MTVPDPPARDPRQRRHAASTVKLARTMYSDGEAWTPSQIRRYLRDVRGIDVSLTTVKTWVVPGAAENQQRANLASYHRRRNGTTGPPGRKAGALLPRMRALREIGVAYSGIAKVIQLDHGVRLTEDQVRYYLKAGREPRVARRASA